MGEINDNDAYEEELLDYEEEDEKAPDSASIKAADSAKKGYVGVHSSGFRDFLLKPELLRSIVDSGFEHPSEGHLRDDILHYSKEPAEYLLSDLPSSYGEGATSSSMGFDKELNKEVAIKVIDLEESFEDLVYQSGPSSWPSSVYAQSAIYPMAQSAAQMTKGFSRVEESFNDLAFDVPDARKQFLAYVEKAKTTGCLDSSFHYGNSINDKENGVCQ